MSSRANYFVSWLLLTGCVLGGVLNLAAAVPIGGVLQRGEITRGAETRHNYSPTIVQTTQGLLVAWVAGSKVEGNDASVYMTRQNGLGWTAPEKIVSREDARSGIQLACRRPVLFQPAVGPVMLFYQSDDSRGQRRGFLSTSGDHGFTWLRAKMLPRGIHGPAGVKPTELADGDLLCGSDDHKAGWTVHVERAAPFRKTWGWSRTRTLTSARAHNASQPVILDHGGRDVQALCRTKRGYLMESWSDDQGETWDPFVRSSLPNPDSGVDVVKLGPESFVLVYQHSNRERGVLNLATTKDGKAWSAVDVLENSPGQTIGDPAMIRGSDGKLHIVYTTNHKQIQYLVFDLDRASPRPMVGGNWPH